MIKVSQSGRDDCLAACVASILELPLEAVPSPLPEEIEDYPVYWSRLNLWMAAEHALELCSIQAEGYPEPYGWSIKVVEVNRHWMEGSLSHAMVACDGRAVWNPCQIETDKDLPATHWIIFRAINPAALTLNYGKLHS